MSKEQTAAAIEATKQLGAERAVEDPVKLERAERIVRTAVIRNRLDVAECITRLVDAAPPLTAKQKADLAALLAPSTADSP